VKSQKRVGPKKSSPLSKEGKGGGTVSKQNIEKNGGKNKKGEGIDNQITTKDQDMPDPTTKGSLRCSIKKLEGKRRTKPKKKWGWKTLEKKEKIGEGQPFHCFVCWQNNLLRPEVFGGCDGGRL